MKIVLCTTIVQHSYKLTHMSSSYRCTTDCCFSFRRLLVVYVFLTKVQFVYLSFLYFLVYFSVFFSVVSTSASDCLERLVSEMTCYVSCGT